MKAIRRKKEKEGKLRERKRREEKKTRRCLVAQMVRAPH